MVLGKTGLVDLVGPPLLFVFVSNQAPLTAAAAASAGLCAALALWRWHRKQPLTYTLLGLGGALLAALFAWLSGTAAGFFLPDLLQSAFIAAACLVSSLIKRPLTALTSRLTRGWPAGWYDHPQVLPAYQKVNNIWAAFFILRTLLQAALLQIRSPWVLLTANLLSGWPATVLLLAASYLYGLQKLRAMKGPSVEEFEKQSPPPWTGQTRGF